MQWTATSTSTFEQAPVGTHAAICIKVIDIGTQEGEYKGERTVRRQNIITWELPLETRDDGQPFIISKFYTTSLGEKANLTKDLTSWLGKAPVPPFDPQQLLGRACQVVITEREGSGKHVISAVTSVPKGMQVPARPHNPTVYFSLDEFDQDVFDSLSEGIQRMIMKSPEYLRAVGGSFAPAAAAVDDVEIPF